jgi:AcrR family transcriptional regulator
MISIIDAERETQERIILGAVGLFLAQGVIKTTMNDVAAQAGVTRVTVYRYFGGKKQLVRAAFMRITSVFREVQKDIYQEQSWDVEECLDRIGAGLEVFPRGDLPARMKELSHLYPDVWREFRETRVATMSKIFNRLFEMASNQGLLREGLNREVIQAYFMDAVVNVMESQSLIALNLPPADIYSTVKVIFLHGILTGEGKTTT